LQRRLIRPDVLAPHLAEPPREVVLTGELVRALLLDQHPDLAELPIAPAAEGWDNVMFRLGEDLALRAPRRRLAADLILHEQAWLPRLAADLPIPAPTPVRIGRPGMGYPWSWSVVPWFEGTPADLSPPGPGSGAALAGFLRAHRAAPDEAPPNPYRGVPFTERASIFEERLAAAAAATGALSPVVMRAWTDGLAAPAAAPRVWVHGDLHGRNVLVRNGRFAAVIDWGDLTAGDPACDLASVWMLLPDLVERSAALAAYGASAALTARARAWAALMSVMLLPIADNPRMPAMARSFVERLEAGP
jgi:aminoglycoside phosphotransferase (APT) family kinase protein